MRTCGSPYRSSNRLDHISAYSLSENSTQMRRFQWNDHPDEAQVMRRRPGMKLSQTKRMQIHSDEDCIQKLADVIGNKFSRKDRRTSMSFSRGPGGRNYDALWDEYSGRGFVTTELLKTMRKDRGLQVLLDDHQGREYLRCLIDQLQTEDCPEVTIDLHERGGKKEALERKKEALRATVKLFESQHPVETPHPSDVTRSQVDESTHNLPRSSTDAHTVAARIPLSLNEGLGDYMRTCGSPYRSSNRLDHISAYSLSENSTQMRRFQWNDHPDEAQVMRRRPGMKLSQTKRMQIHSDEDCIQKLADVIGNKFSRKDRRTSMSFSRGPGGRNYDALWDEYSGRGFVTTELLKTMRKDRGLQVLLDDHQGREYLRYLIDQLQTEDCPEVTIDLHERGGKKEALERKKEALRATVKLFESQHPVETPHPSDVTRSQVDESTHNLPRSSTDAHAVAARIPLSLNEGLGDYMRTCGSHNLPRSSTDAHAVAARIPLSTHNLPRSSTDAHTVAARIPLSLNEGLGDYMRTCGSHNLPRSSTDAHAVAARIPLSTHNLPRSSTDAHTVAARIPLSTHNLPRSSTDAHTVAARIPLSTHNLPRSSTDAHAVAARIPLSTHNLPRSSTDAHAVAARIPLSTHNLPRSSTDAHTVAARIPLSTHNLPRSSTDAHTVAARIPLSTHNLPRSSTDAHAVAARIPLSTHNLPRSSTDAHTVAARIPLSLNEGLGDYMRTCGSHNLPRSSTDAHAVAARIPLSTHNLPRSSTDAHTVAARIPLSTHNLPRSSTDAHTVAARIPLSTHNLPRSSTDAHAVAARIPLSTHNRPRSSTDAHAVATRIPLSTHNLPRSSTDAHAVAARIPLSTPNLPVAWGEPSIMDKLEPRLVLAQVASMVRVRAMDSQKASLTQATSTRGNPNTAYETAWVRMDNPNTAYETAWVQEAGVHVPIYRDDYCGQRASFCLYLCFGSARSWKNQRLCLQISY